MAPTHLLVTFLCGAALLLFPAANAQPSPDPETALVVNLVAGLMANKDILLEVLPSDSALDLDLLRSLGEIGETEQRLALVLALSEREDSSQLALHTIFGHLVEDACSLVTAKLNINCTSTELKKLKREVEALFKSMEAIKRMRSYIIENNIPANNIYGDQWISMNNLHCEVSDSALEIINAAFPLPNGNDRFSKANCMEL